MPSRPSLVRDIAVVLAAKLVALAALYWLFFDHASRPQVTPEAARRHVAPAAAARD